MRRLDDLSHRVAREPGGPGTDPELDAAIEDELIEFGAGLADDLNVSRALGAVFRLARAAHVAMDRGALPTATRDRLMHALERIDGVLALSAETPAALEAEVEAAIEAARGRAPAPRLGRRRSDPRRARRSRNRPRGHAAGHDLEAAGLMDPRHELGQRAEDAAARVLEDAGYRLRARRFRTRLGEIDLVAEDRAGTFVFVEVKARSGSGYGEPLEAVDRRRQARLARAATLYLQARGALERACRFDVVSVRAEADGRLAVEHLVDAFRPEADRGGYARRSR